MTARVSFGFLEIPCIVYFNWTILLFRTKNYASA
jgi:hypothetical protein